MVAPPPRGGVGAARRARRGSSGQRVAGSAGRGCDTPPHCPAPPAAHPGPRTRRGDRRQVLLRRFDRVSAAVGGRASRHAALARQLGPGLVGRHRGRPTGRQWHGDRPDDDERQRRADQGGEQEQPDVGQRLTAGEQRRAERPGGVHRRAGEGDADQVDGGEAQADRQSGEARRRRLAGDQQDHRDEGEGQQRLEDEGAAQADRGAVVVGPERSRLVGDVPESAGQELEDRRTDDAAGELRDPVVGRLGRGHPAGEQHAEGHRRVDVAPGDRADGVGERQQHEAEGERDTRRTDRVDADDGRADGDHHEQRRTDELGGEGSDESGRHRAPPDRPQPPPARTVRCPAVRTRRQAAPGRTGHARDFRRRNFRRGPQPVGAWP